MADLVRGIVNSKSLSPEQKEAVKAKLSEVCGQTVSDYLTNGPRYPNWTLGMQTTVEAIKTGFGSMRPMNRVVMTTENFDIKVFGEAVTVIRDMPVDISGYPGKLGREEWSTHSNEFRNVLTESLFSGSEYGFIRDRIQREINVPRQLYSEIVFHNSLLDKTINSGYKEESFFSLSPLSSDEVVLIHFHGGSYCYECPGTYRRAMIDISKATGCRVFLPKYRLAPDHPFPAAILDGAEFYYHMQSLGYKPENIIVCGDSAGGNLALSLLQVLKAAGSKQPRGAISISPWSDLNPITDSYVRNLKYDFLANIPISSVYNPSGLYLNPGKPLNKEIYELMKSPFVSPVCADYDGCPPIYVQSGELELIVDDIDKLGEKIGSKQVMITGKDHPGFESLSTRNAYEKFYGMVHVPFLFEDAAEYHAILEGIGNWVKKLTKESKLD
ncbi:hypothetical protein BB560_005734 [Smittium megazygosporum]|uniref:Alpha/beta hydrolase fold-3 domain-containing protein n=1 Tax=Smittium megazygosporum TaxID=133381 RepID=A0A2T9YYV9_9FUNG|nr:hypothetical protein BB560_005734 [Smittium megazygosporum]